MNLSRISKSLLLGTALLLSTSAFAANKGSLQVPDPVTVGGKQLAPGDYALQWDGSGPNIELNILQGRKVVATVPARLIDLNHSAEYNSAVVRKNEDGSRALTEIRFGGKKYALAVGEAGAQAEMKASDGTTK